MAKTRVDLSVAPSPATLKHFLFVDGLLVPTAQGKGHTEIDAGDHILQWTTFGSPGDSISIEGTAGGQKVIDVKSSKIPNPPPGQGHRRFKV